MQRIWFRFWIVLWPLSVCLFFYPINSLLIRVGLLASLLGVWAGCFLFGRRNKIFCAALLLLTFLIVGFLICPGKDYDRKQLRDAYVRALRSYEGTRYIWGGEDMLGIDCSGLVRAGLIKATFKEGLLTFNPRLTRFALSLWWHDASAEALGQEYRQQTRRLFATSSINELDQNKAVPGDIAVTTSGIHVLAYLGDSKWIEADPNLGKVVIVQVPARTNLWFQEHVNVLRWSELNVQ
jgi:hypothetical protein